MMVMIIERTDYIKKIEPVIDKHIIKVLTGVRRSGKSTLLKQIIKHLKYGGVPDKNIIWINFELSEFFEINDISKLEEYIDEKTKDINGKIYLFFDEIQIITDWERLINSYFAQEKYDIYVTGSNSKLLSGELATLLAGRYVHIDVYPFSFKEYLEYYEVQNNIKDHFIKYLENGGMPSTLEYVDENRKIVLMDLYNSIVLKDIIQRNKIKNIDLLDRLIRFIMYNIGQSFSANKVYNRLKQDLINLSVNSIYNYIKYFENACIIHQVRREDLEGKKILKHDEKYYVCDLGLRETIIGNNTRDITRVIENIVFMELLRRGYKVSIGKIGKLEVDFVCKKNNQRIYVQVSYLLSDEDTVKREFKPLKMIQDNYPKYVITMDDLNFSHDGIIHMNLIDFLTKNEENDNR